MNEFYKEAMAKLDDGVKADCGRYGNAMRKAVRDALADFCKQNAEFAQAVAQGGSFQDCMAAVSKGVSGNSISDVKAFGLAVAFYFPGAEIKVKMTLDLCASVKKDEPGIEAEVKSTGVIIDLSAFF